MAESREHNGREIREILEGVELGVQRTGPRPNGAGGSRADSGDRRPRQADGERDSTRTRAPLHWFKTDPNWPTNEKLLAAGWRSIPLWFLLLALNARLEWGGIIPERWANVRRLTAALALLEMPEDQVAAGVRGLFVGGLIVEVLETGEWELTGWDANEWGRPPIRCVRCGRGNAEPRFRSCPSCRGKDRARKREK